jgi:hypothetical protein
MKIVDRIFSEIHANHRNSISPDPTCGALVVTPLRNRRPIARTAPLPPREEGHASPLRSDHFTLPQLKIIQEVITLAVFVPFALLYMKTPLSWNYLWAALCLLGAVYFIFRAP